jgi:hypothetical protein
MVDGQSETHGFLYLADISAEGAWTWSCPVCNFGIKHEAGRVGNHRSQDEDCSVTGQLEHMTKSMFARSIAMGSCFAADGYCDAYTNQHDP